MNSFVKMVVIAGSFFPYALHAAACAPASAVKGSPTSGILRSLIGSFSTYAPTSPGFSIIQAGQQASYDLIRYAVENNARKVQEKYQSSAYVRSSLATSGYEGGADGAALIEFCKKEGLIPAVSASQKNQGDQIDIAFTFLAEAFKTDVNNAFDIITDVMHSLAKPTAETLKEEIIKALTAVIRNQTNKTRLEQETIIRQCRKVFNSKHAGFIFNKDCERNNLDNSRRLFSGVIAGYYADAMVPYEFSIDAAHLGVIPRKKVVKEFVESVMVLLAKNKELPKGITLSDMEHLIAVHLADKDSFLSVAIESLDQGYTHDHTFLNNIQQILVGTLISEALKQSLACEKAAAAMPTAHPFEADPSAVAESAHARVPIKEGDNKEEARAVQIRLPVALFAAINQNSIGALQELKPLAYLNVWRPPVAGMHEKNLGEVAGLEKLSPLEIWKAQIASIRDADGNSLLHCAVAKNNLEIVQFLLENGAQDCIPSVNKFGETVLHVAARNSSEAIVSCLLDNGAEFVMPLQDKMGETALHCAVRSSILGIKRSVIIVDLFLKKGASVNLGMKNSQGEMPLHVALSLEPSSYLLVLSLVTHAAPGLLHEVTSAGNTPLHIAARYCPQEMMVLLLGQGAQESLFVKNKNGQTPLAYCKNWPRAKALEQRTIEKFLQQKMTEYKKHKDAASRKAEEENKAKAEQARLEHEKKIKTDAKAARKKAKQEKEQAEQEEAEKRTKEAEALQLKLEHEAKAKEEAKQKKEAEKRKAHNAKRAEARARRDKAEQEAQERSELQELVPGTEHDAHVAAWIAAQEDATRAAKLAADTQEKELNDLVLQEEVGFLQGIVQKIGFVADADMSREKKEAKAQSADKPRSYKFISGDGKVHRMQIMSAADAMSYVQTETTPEDALVLDAWQQMLNAIQQKNFKALKRIKGKASHDQWQDLITRSDRQTGSTLLHYACGQDCSEIVQILLKDAPKESICYQNLAGETPLHSAVILFSRHPDASLKIIKLLLVAGAAESMNTFSLKYGVPLHCALMICSKARVVLPDMAPSATLELVKLLVEHTSQENICLANFMTGATSLHIAVEGCSVPVIKHLLKNGAEKTLLARDKAGKTPMALALEIPRTPAEKKMLVGILNQAMAQHANRAKEEVKKAQEELRKQKEQEDLAAARVKVLQERQRKAEAKAARKKAEAEAKIAEDLAKTLEAEKQQKEHEECQVRIERENKIREDAHKQREAEALEARKLARAQKLEQREQKRAADQKEAEARAHAELQRENARRQELQEKGTEFRVQKNKEQARIAAEHSQAAQARVDAEKRAQEIAAQEKIRNEIAHREAEAKVKADAEVLRSKEERDLKDKAEAAKIVADILEAQELKKQAALKREQEVKGKQEAAASVEKKITHAQAYALARKESWTKRLFEPALLTQAILDTCLKEGISLESVDVQGNTPLVVATLSRDQNAMDLLCKAGANVSTVIKSLAKRPVESLAGFAARYQLERQEHHLENIKIKRLANERALMPEGISSEEVSRRQAKRSKEIEETHARLERVGAISYPVYAPCASPLPRVDYSPSQREAFYLQQQKAFEGMRQAEAKKQQEQKMFDEQCAQAEARQQEYYNKKKALAAEAAHRSRVLLITKINALSKTIESYSGAVTREHEKALAELIFEAIRHGDEEAIRASFACHKVDIKRLKDSNGNTVLMAAIQYAQLAVFSMLLEKYGSALDEKEKSFGDYAYALNGRGESMSTLAAACYSNARHRNETPTVFALATMMKMLSDKKINFLKMDGNHINAFSFLNIKEKTPKKLEEFFEKALFVHKA